jgi:hypothetical protein
MRVNIVRELVVQVIGRGLRVTRERSAKRNRHAGDDGCASDHMDTLR